MPRLARLDAVGVLQHVMVRGIEKRDIFLDDHDRRFFLERLSQLLLKTQTTCLAWCLMTNHFHLLLRPQKLKLSFFMRRLLTSYATTFNLRHKRVGHLFQNRYKSIVCEDEPYLLELVRYIHLNPVRAGLVKDGDGLSCYSWSGHMVILGSVELPGQDVADVLSRFGDNATEAREKYACFVEEAFEAGHREEFSGGGMRRSCLLSRSRPGEESYDARVLGSGDFVEQLWGEQEEQVPPPGISLEHLVREVAAAYGIDSGLLCQPNKTRTISNARSVTCYLALRSLGYSGVRISRMLGITSAGVSIAASKGEAILQDPACPAAIANLKILATSP